MDVQEAAQLATAVIGPISDLQVDIPRIAKDPASTACIDKLVQRVDTSHQLLVGDARLKRYNDTAAQLGHVDDYDEFLGEIDKVWSESFRVLAPGGRLICVVGDVCLSRRQNHGRHTVIPLQSSISERCRRIGFDGLAPIIWHKIANVAMEAVGNGGGFLGKPYEPNAVIKNDIEFILMLRKPGGYRKPTQDARLLSVVSSSNQREWFQQIWTGISGASTRDHPAPFPIELAERLVRMFSFVGDTILDPFVGSGTTLLAAGRWGRNGIGVDIDARYAADAAKRLLASLPDTATLTQGPVAPSIVSAA